MIIKKPFIQNFSTFLTTEMENCYTLILKNLQYFAHMGKTADF